MWPKAKPRKPLRLVPCACPYSALDVLLLLHGRLGDGPGICARRLVVGFRLVLARPLSSAALRFASREGYFAVAIGFCDGHIVGLVRGIVVEFDFLVIDLLVRF